MGKQEPKSERPRPRVPSRFVDRPPRRAPRDSRPGATPRARPDPGRAKTDPHPSVFPPRPPPAADSRFTQQQLPAWRPTLTPAAVRTRP